MEIHCLFVVCEPELGVLASELAGSVLESVVRLIAMVRVHAEIEAPFGASRTGAEVLALSDALWRMLCRDARVSYGRNEAGR